MKNFSPLIFTSLKKYFLWFFIGILGAIALSYIALIRDEQISSLWLITACICTQLIAYRFYSFFIAFKVLEINPKNPTPATRINDGKDFVPTNRLIVFGHHFAAIAGPGPLIGPTLAAQFGYLPSTLWIVIGSVFAGAVQDMIILFASIRRDGKSLGQMIKDEIGKISGFTALISTLAIIIILISVLGLVVVKALMHSPWGSFTVFMTIPIAMIIGVYLRFIRIGKVFEATFIGVALFALAIYGGKIVNYHPFLSQIFDKDAKFLAFCVIIYGFFAATLPIWLLLAPRDYLSSFLKIGTIFLLIIAILIFQPNLKMPALTQFIDGSGPIFSGKIFPFLFITIACGAISGFHALVASGTTPKIIGNENDIRLVGYGSMLLEGLVAICAVIAASIIEPGVFFAINVAPERIGNNLNEAIQTINSWGFEVSLLQMQELANQMGEKTLFGRVGGAPSLAVGMAQIFSSAFNKSTIAIWYHFAIMFEAIFILTTLDAGTRVARFMLQDLLKNFKSYKKFNDKLPNLSTIFTSFLIVFSWGYFLYIGVIDKNGGVNMLWPLFGMSNQMLAGIAMILATIIISKTRKRNFIFITLIPLIFIITTTTNSAFQKIFSTNTNIGFFAKANDIKLQIEAGIVENIELANQAIFNQKLVGFLTLFFLISLWIILIEGAFVIIKNYRNVKKEESPYEKNR